MSIFYIPLSTRVSLYLELILEILPNFLQTKMKKKFFLNFYRVKIKLELNIIQLENQLRATHHEMETKETEFKKENLELLEKHQNLLGHSQSSSSSLSSLSGNTSSNNNTTSTPVKREILLEETLSSHLVHQVDCLAKIYNCIDERKLSTQQVSKQAVKSEQLLMQQIAASISNKFKNLDRIIAEFFESNHSLIQSVLNDLTSSKDNGSSEMDTLNKKLKIYLNKLDLSLFVNETSLSKQLSQLIQLTLFSNGSNLNSTSFSSSLAKNLSSICDILDKVLFVLNEKLSMQYTQDLPANVTTLDECNLSYLTQLKQSLVQLAEFVQANSTCFFEIISKLVASVRQQKAALSNEEINNEAASFNGGHLSYAKDLESLRIAIGKKDLEIKELNDKCDKYKEKSLKDADDMERLRFKLG